MPELALLQEVIATGGNVAMMVVAIALWKLDRRVVRLETLLEKAVKHEMA
ncbi:hypothetical protein [Parvibaculum sp.]|nr:hypothetical protein [Parvibaculum sp.]MBX3487850.1 hypothetical protein [Parvibaculum sp.]